MLIYQRNIWPFSYKKSFHCSLRMPALPPSGRLHKCRKIPNITSLLSKLLAWRETISSLDRQQLPEEIYEVFHVTSNLLNVCAIACILMTLLVTSCFAQQWFSALKSMKTKLWSMVTEDRRKALMLMSIHGEESLPIDEVIDKYMTCCHCLSNKWGERKMDHGKSVKSWLVLCMYKKFRIGL